MTDERDKPSMTADAWSADQLRNYQTRIARLANFLRQDVTQNSAQTDFSLADVEILQAAVGVLKRFENRIIDEQITVTDIKTPQDAARNEALERAEELAKRLFPASPHNVLLAAKLALAIEASIDDPKNRTGTNDVRPRIEQAMNQTDLRSASSLIYQCYSDQISQLARAFLDIRGKHINDRYVEDWSRRVRKVLDNPNQAQQEIITALEKYLIETPQ